MDDLTFFMAEDIGDTAFAEERGDPACVERPPPDMGLTLGGWRMIREWCMSVRSCCFMRASTPLERRDEPPDTDGGGGEDDEVPSRCTIPKEPNGSARPKSTRTMKRGTNQRRSLSENERWRAGWYRTCKGDGNAPFNKSLYTAAVAPSLTVVKARRGSVIRRGNKALDAYQELTIINDHVVVM